ncbi:MAG: NADH-quinone oxidoreductase subunit A [Solirubrobacterales bacterium]|nr:NADH-quinone oxidoreductase subunit A [Solirubrobacterales bacterium]
MLNSYLPAIVLLLLGGIVGTFFALMNGFFGPKTNRRSESKLSPYECGLPSEVQQGFRFGISFYMIAMLFIVFDIEVVMLYPIAVKLKEFGTFAVTETSIFITLLFVGFGYVWRRGALSWR